MMERSMGERERKRERRLFKELTVVKGNIYWKREKKYNPAPKSGGERRRKTLGKENLS